MDGQCSLVDHRPAMVIGRWSLVNDRPEVVDGLLPASGEYVVDRLAICGRCVVDKQLAMTGRRWWWLKKRN